MEKSDVLLVANAGQPSRSFNNSELEIFLAKT
jgi:hypothetical protein